MAPDKQEASLRLLIEQCKAQGYMLFDQFEKCLSGNHNGGPELEQAILVVENAGIEILDEPRADFEARFARIPHTDLYTGDPINVYVNEVCKISMLSRGREIELSSLIQSDHPRTAEIARKELVEANLRVVVAIAQRYANRGVHVLDLIQEGNDCLLLAVNKFDGNGGYRFSSYAIWWIRQAIIRVTRVH